MSTSPQRYFVGSDRSAHRYLIPVEKRQEWEEWCGIDEDDERSWVIPAFARQLDGWLSRLTFTDPKEENT